MGLRACMDALGKIKSLAAAAAAAVAGIRTSDFPSRNLITVTPTICIC